jgi:hypothetical protein
MMVFFNDPVAFRRQERDPDGLAMRDRVADLAVGWQAGYGSTWVWIRRVFATIGAIGFEGRWDYGAIGSVPNPPSGCAARRDRARCSPPSAWWRRSRPRRDGGRGRPHPEETRPSRRWRS